MVALPLLSLHIGLPLVGSLLVACLHATKHAGMARWVALGCVSLTCALTWPLIHAFNMHSSAMQFVEHHAWIPSLHMDYYLGVDGLSMPLLVLTVWTNLVIVLASWALVKERVGEYLAAFLMLQSMVVGVFAALDGVLFYLFWEGMLIPMILIIGVWGSQMRSFAAMKFFLYTFFGSALMLLAILACGLHAHSFSILRWAHLHMPANLQMLLFIAFSLAFAVKVPMWPVHTWLPDAHTEAPAGGSVMLAALMLKVGAYGFYRFCLPVTPHAASVAAPVMIALSLVAIVSIGLIAIAQTDMKRLIAYSSVAHMGFVTLGCFAVYPLMRLHQPTMAVLAMEGGWIQMIAHAFGSGAMFLAFGLLYERLHTRTIAQMGGIANTMPVFSALFVLFCLSNVALPGTAGFVGEFMVLMAVFKAHVLLTLLAGLTVIISATYTLGMVKRVFYGPVASKAVEALVDIPMRERLICGFLALGIFAIGVAPAAWLKPMHATARAVVAQAVRGR